jgi:hypothetical protein
VPRKTAVRIWRALVEVIGRAISAATPEDAVDLSGHCDYCSPLNLHENGC